MNRDLIFRKKFLFACGVVILSSVIFLIKEGWGAEYFRDIVIGIGGLYLGSQAYVDARKPEGTK